MGNKLVCCRWRWIESPEFVNRVEENNAKYATNIEGYANGYVNHVASGDNGYTCHKTRQSHCVPPDAVLGANGTTRPPYGLTDLGLTYGVGGGLPGPIYASRSAGGRPTVEPACRDSWMVRSNEQLQHISEREPEDADHDPSVNARNPTLFLQRIRPEDRPHAHARPPSPLRQWSSCATVLLDDTTISQPNPALSLKTLALAVHLHVRLPDDDLGNGARTRGRYRCGQDDPVYAIFDERRHPVVVRQAGAGEGAGGHPQGGSRPPSHREIYRFLRGIFNMAQLTPECAIVTLVYLERLLGSAEMEMVPWSWRRQLLASVLLASKVWDDQAVWNADYCQILKELAVEDVNELERAFLELIQFNINVPSSVYAHYYFDLLQLGRAHGLYGPQAGGRGRRPLSWGRAVRLEAASPPGGALGPGTVLRRCPSWQSVVGARSRPFLLS